MGEVKLSVPLRLLFEGIGHTVTVEMKNHESYRGELVEAEESMNVQMTNVLHTARDGSKRRLERIYLRGTNIKFVVLPTFLKEATIFRPVATMKLKEDKKVAAKEQTRKTQQRKKV